MSSLADVDTVAGLTTHTLGKFPEVGESVEIENFIFRVIEASERRVVMLEVKKNS